MNFLPSGPRASAPLVVGTVRAAYPCMLSRDQKAGGWGDRLDTQSLEIPGRGVACKIQASARLHPSWCGRLQGNMNECRKGFQRRTAFETLHTEGTFPNRIGPGSQQLASASSLTRSEALAMSIASSNHHLTQFQSGQAFPACPGTFCASVWAHLFIHALQSLDVNLSSNAT